MSSVLVQIAYCPDENQNPERHIRDGFSNSSQDCPSEQFDNDDYYCDRIRQQTFTHGCSLDMT